MTNLDENVAAEELVEKVERDRLVLIGTFFNTAQNMYAQTYLTT